MSQYYGVICKTCEDKFIQLGSQTKEQGKLTIYDPGLDPHPCSECGSSWTYGSDDVVDEVGVKL
jgi:hypothetical protein